MKRIEGVDALRGLLASGVMVYHFLSWSKSSIYVSYHDVLEILAVSFVEIFFVISGFSLFYVYQSRLDSFNSVKRFFIRRFFRIAPLFYFLLTIVVALKLIAIYFGVDVNRPLNVYLLTTNFTFLFGLLRPSDSLLVAGWSIGVEMALYLLFPFLLMCAKNIYMASLSGLVSILIVFIYSLFFLNESENFTDQWVSYVYFLNHLHYFVGGIFIFYIFDKYQDKVPSRSMFWLLLIILTSISFVLLFYARSVEHVLIGNIRYGILLVCLLIVFLFSLSQINSKFLLHLGDLSYSIYLGHFFVFLIVSKVFEESMLILGLGVIGTYAFASFTHKYIEKPMIRLGKKFG